MRKGARPPIVRSESGNEQATQTALSYLASLVSQYQEPAAVTEEAGAA